MSLRDILSLDEPHDARLAAVRKAQLDTFVRLVPMTVITQLVTAATLVASFRDVIDSFWLGLWFGAALILCFIRVVRAIRLRVDLNYAQTRPPRLRHIFWIITGLAALWLVPTVLWFDAAGPDQRLFLCVLVAALVSAGTVTLSAVPPAAFSYIGLMAFASAVITYKLDNMPMMGLALIYAGLLGWAVVTGARQFFGHVFARLELEERGAIIELLREFEASGSAGLWELDRELRIVTMSRELAQAADRELEELVGIPANRLLDPTGQAVAISTGMRSLFDHLDRGEEFRDLAVPAMVSGRWWSLSGKPICDSRGEVLGWRGVGSDITELRLAGDDAVRAARQDPLTGLANRLLIREELEEALLFQWRQGRPCALLLVDLDRFKLVNDTLGHAIGDQLLIEVARRLEMAVGNEGHVGRLGGDEFAVVWTGDDGREALAELAMTIIADLSRAFHIGAATLHIGATVGIARGPSDGQREEKLMRSADLALYSAKDGGRGSYAFFQPAMLQHAEQERELENDVRNALSENGLKLAYQPIVDAVTGELVGREALLRWTHPERGEIPPDRFIPIIEDAGLIHRIGDWVIREACAQAVAWPEHVRVAVNVSAAQLSGAGLAKTVVGALASSGLSPHRLELEVTESVFLGDDADTLASLERLRGLGVRLVLDDFGKGYSSFGYLSRARFSKIKIDQSFVRGAADGARDCVAIVHAILALARGLGVETTAEGVETEAQAEVMRCLGVSQMQGYHYGRPALPEPALPIADNGPRKQRA